jgi:type 1 glutamine amidotransferase
MSPHIPLLVFSKTTGYRHTSIPAGIAAFHRLAAQSTSPRLTITATEDTTIFTADGLSTFKAIVLLQTSGDFLSPTQMLALHDFVRGGGGVVGVHCASTGMPSDPWYGRMIGAVFTDHPDPQAGLVRVEDKEHAIIKGTVGKGKGDWVHAGDDVGGTTLWKWFDEWYNFAENPRSIGEVHVLLSVDETSFEGGKHGEDHPIAWCQEFEGGRTFYTALGHFGEAYEDEAFLGQLYNAVLWTSRVTE